MADAHATMLSGVHLSNTSLSALPRRNNMRSWTADTTSIVITVAYMTLLG
ncbi:hypothetical protein Pogu_2109 [Pyrobaculum oguniense TE7]|uniref:Uncharacterized protein n=1 Tax=Pyrobaculum oguniense (strain DSM 13380 / JCM 10595 / TE7) TaxID=698757 RepID=H6QCU0_PYROT|nr:hypothetical protein Pogu_2109 [Pyrobaculum oguniense TE7]